MSPQQQALRPEEASRYRTQTASDFLEQLLAASRAAAPRVFNPVQPDLYSPDENRSWFDAEDDRYYGLTERNKSLPGVAWTMST